MLPVAGFVGTSCICFPSALFRRSKPCRDSLAVKTLALCCLQTPCRQRPHCQASIPGCVSAMASNDAQASLPSARARPASALPAQQQTSIPPHLHLLNILLESTFPFVEAEIGEELYKLFKASGWESKRGCKPQPQKPCYCMPVSLTKCC